MSRSRAKWYQSPKLQFGRYLRSLKRGRVPEVGKASGGVSPAESLAERGIDEPEIVVVGAGLAGASTAYALAERGYGVRVLEAESAAALQGSGNPQGMLYLKLSAHETAQTALLLPGFSLTLRYLAHFTEAGVLTKGVDWDDCGVLQLAYNEGEARRQEKLAARYPKTLLQPLSKRAASRIAGVPLSSGGIFFPTAGWVAPRAFTQALLSHPNIVLETGVTVHELHQHTSPEQFERLSEADKFAALQWELRGEKTTPKGQEARCYRAKVVVLANAEKVINFSQTEALPIHKSRGQVTTVARRSTLQTVVSGAGYVAPTLAGVGTTFGATFRVEAPDLIPNSEEHRENIAMLKANSPELYRELGLAMAERRDSSLLLSGRAAYRANAMGYLPVIGPIADRTLFLERFAQIRKDAKAIPEGEVPWLYGLYLNSGHGSRGMITAPLSGEMLAHEILSGAEGGQLARFPVKPFVREALHPNRFYFHELRFNK